MAKTQNPLPRRLVIGTLIVCALVIMGLGALYFLLVKVPTDLAMDTAQGIRQVFDFTPRVTINHTVVIEQNSPILEVATLSRDIHVIHRWNHQWLKSTKTVELEATFTAKAGFDLREPFDIDIRRFPLSVQARMPPPRILSLEMNHYRILVDKDGWWNQVTDQDREQAVGQLQATAREKVAASGILEEARDSAEERVREIVKSNGANVTFLYPWEE